MAEQNQASNPPSKLYGASVNLPDDAEPPYEVFISGVPQKQGIDFKVDGRRLRFARELQQEGKLGFWRWLFIFLGIAGSYGKNDVIDVTYNRGGQRLIKSGLKLEPDQPASPDA